MTQLNLRVREGATSLFIACLALVCVLVVTPAFGQENYGSLSGVVTDATGSSVPNATIELTSPAVPRGVQTTTDEKGQYNLPRIPNAMYSMSVSKQGFSKFVQRNLEVKLGSSMVFNVNLKVGAVAEVVEVTDSATQLDLTSSTTSTNITAAQFENLPKGRNFHTLLAMAPGVRFEPKNGNAGVGGFQVDGASGAENAFLIDGVDTSDIRRGSLRVQNSVPFEFLSELQIKSSGFGAEFGGATGGVMNTTTKGGSNSFHGVALLNYTNDTLNPRPRGYYKRSPASADRADFFAPKEDSYNLKYPGFTLGGPIVKNTLFFSLGYMPQLENRTRTIDYASGSRTWSRKDTVNYGLARLDFNPSTKLQTYASWLWAPWKSSGRLPTQDPRIPAPTNNLTAIGGFQPAQTFNTGATYTLTSHWFVSGRYGYKYQNDKMGNYGLSGAPYLSYQTSSAAVGAALGANIPAPLVGGTGFINVSSTFGTIFDTTNRHNLYLDSNYIATIGGKQHSIKFGYALARVSNQVKDDYSNGFFQVFWGDAYSRGSIRDQRGTYGYYIWQDGVRHDSGANSRNQGFYIQDDIRVTQRLTLNLGVRFENEFLPPYVKEVNGIKVANPISFNWGDKIAPRLGFAWSPDTAGKWKIAGSFGLYYDVMKYELARGSFGSDYWFSHVYKLDNPNLLALGKASPGAGGALINKFDNRTIPINARGELEGIDPGIKPYASREFTGTVTREIKAGLLATVRYVHKDLLRGIEDIGVLDAEDNEVYLIGNPGFGQTRDTKTDYGKKTPNGQEFLVPKAVRKYDGLEFRLDGRYFRKLNVMTSYTWSRLFGNYSGSANSDESGRQDPGVSRAFDLPYYYFDATGSQKNVLGRLGTDRPHTFKGFISYEMRSKLGTTNWGLSQIAFSGTPDTTSIIYLSAPTFPYGRGDMGRTPTLTQTDLNVSHDIPLKSERMRIRLEANILNLFNQAAVVSRITQINRSSAVTIDPSVFFKGYDPKAFLTSTPPVAGKIPYNPIYGLPSGDYRGTTVEGTNITPGIACCGTGGYQTPREIRLGLRFLF